MQRDYKLHNIVKKKKQFNNINEEDSSVSISNEGFTFAIMVQTADFKFKPKILENRREPIYM